MPYRKNGPGIAKHNPPVKAIALDLVFASLLVISFVFADICFSPFFSLSENQEGYAERQVEELASFASEKGVELGPIEVIRTQEGAPAQDSETLSGASSCAWATFHTGTQEKQIWLQPQCETSYQTIAHETAHQVMFSKGYYYEDHHSMPEFLYWEFCLSASAKFHTNLC